MILEFDLTEKATNKGIVAFGSALVACIVLIVLVYFIVKKCVPKCNKSVQKLCQRVKNMLMFNSILRYFMMIYLGLTTGSCLIITKALQDPDNFNQLTLTLAIIVLITFSIMIWPLTHIILKNRKRLVDPNFRQSYGTLYTPCETHAGVWPLLFITVFLVRRLLIAMVSSFLINYPLFQILITLALSTVVMFWHVLVWPMENTLQNVIYLLNEYLYSLCSLWSLAFSDYNVSPETRFVMGWFYLGLLGLILLPNLSLILYEIGKGIVSFCMDRYKKR